MTRIFLALAAVLALSACAGTPAPQAPVVRTETVPVGPPDSLLTCRVAPLAPTGDEYTQADVARYIVRLSEAGEDCRSKLNAVRRWVDEEVAR